MKDSPTPRQFALLLIVAATAVFIHGYHPFVEDGEIYVPGIKKILNPALYPYNQGFFASHAGMTLFPELIAWSIRLAHVPLEWGLFVWQFASVFLLLLGCWHVGRLAFPEARARWGGVALVASLLTIPVAGTSLYIMDQYLTTRALSAPAAIFILVNTLERKLARAALWCVFVLLIHPLMAVFAVSFCVALLWETHKKSVATEPVALALTLFPLHLFPPVTDAYREVLQRRPYFFLLQWQWYEWIGLLAPFAVFWWFQRIARARRLPVVAQLSRAMILFGAVCFAASLIIAVPPAMAGFTELQPMRYLHLTYIVMFVLGGGLVAEFVLKNHVWRWALLFLPLAAGMAFAEHSLFPATPRIEWPGAASSNDWVRAFVWIRRNTPNAAYFALNPDHMGLPGEDQHGFRAMAERSMLADRLKDSGAAIMFPALAETWRQQVRAQDAWKSFTAEDFRRLRNQFGVDWIVHEQPPPPGLDCPFQNKTVSVCRIP